jgi:hypothetical protein
MEDKPMDGYPDHDALARIGAAIANALWSEMTTEQIEELVDHDLRSWAVTTVFANVGMPYIAWMHDPPEDQTQAKGTVQP